MSREDQRNGPSDPFARGSPAAILGERLTLNERRKWLVGEKGRRTAKQVDRACLEDYVRKKGEHTK